MKEELEKLSKIGGSPISNNLSGVATSWLHYLEGPSKQSLDALCERLHGAAKNLQSFRSTWHADIKVECESLPDKSVLYSALKNYRANYDISYELVGETMYFNFYGTPLTDYVEEIEDDLACIIGQFTAGKLYSTLTSNELTIEGPQ